MNMNEWLAELAAALDVEPVEPTALLDLTRDVAHGVARPAAPLSCYLIGVAVGRGLSLSQAMQVARGVIPPPEVTTGDASG